MTSSRRTVRDRLRTAARSSLALWFVVVSAASGEKYSDQFANHLNGGNELAKTGQYQRAIREFEAAIRIDSSHPRPFVSRATAYKEMGLLDQAVEDYTKAIERGGDDSEATAIAYGGRGEIHLRRGRLAEGIADCEAALKLNPRDGASLNNLRLGQRQLATQNRPASMAAVAASPSATTAPGTWQNWYDLTQKPENDPYSQALIEEAEQMKRQARRHQPQGVMILSQNGMHNISPLVILVIGSLLAFGAAVCGGVVGFVVGRQRSRD
jgi:tetratricopeptide (TPR) repeat protein